jgi:hypothetical protein
MQSALSGGSMSTLDYKGITWTMDDKRTFRFGSGKCCSHQDRSIVYDKDLDLFLFMRDDCVIFGRELFSDCIRDATDCILDTYASFFVPSWEKDDAASFQEVQE